MQKQSIKIQIALIGALLIYLYWDALAWMIGQWENNPNYGHGWLIPLAMGYMIFKKKDIFKADYKSTLKDLWLVFAGVVIFLLGARIEFIQITLFSLLVIALGLVYFYKGKTAFKEMLFPVGYFVFGIPVPYYLESFTVPLKSMATVVSVGFMQMAGITIARQGNIIYLPNYTLEVADACSGLKSLVMVTAVGALYAYISQPTLKRKWVLFLSSIPIAVIANIARIVMVGILASIFGEKLAFDFVHDFSGIFVFIIAGVCLALTGVLMEWIIKKRVG
jgi:exosortase